MDQRELAMMAAEAALVGGMVELRLPVDWQRPTGIPFPGVRPKVADAEDGTAIWAWRPAAIILWIYDINKPGGPDLQGETA